MATTKGSSAKKSPSKKKKPKNQLEKLEMVTADEIDRNRKKVRKKKTKTPSSTRAAKQARAGGRKPAKVPKNKSSSEILAMDPDDPEFKHPQGRKRKWDYNDPDLDTTQMTITEIGRYEKQQSANRIRAKTRKSEAVTEKVAQEEFGDAQVRGFAEGEAMYAEDVLIAEGKLSIDDWDEEELIRGYRRDRNGRFGSPPRFIPREVQQEAFRRLVRVGERKLRQKYLVIIDQLIALVEDPNTSDKVKLEAIKEIQNRVVGKTPDVVVTTEAPWQDMLVDSVVPLSEALPLEVHGTIKSLPSDAGGDQPSAAAATPASSPSASESRSSMRESAKKKQPKTVNSGAGIEAGWEDDDDE